MCLSRVINVTESGEKQIGEYICKVRVSGDEIQLLDIMGQLTTVKGRILDIDLVGNQIRVAEKV